MKQFVTLEKSTPAFVYIGKEIANARILYYLFFLLASFYIIGSTYLGLNGHHVWRQSDVFGQILGFLHYKGILPFQNMYGEVAVYDLPLYQYLVSAISKSFDQDPLTVVKYLNLAFWAVLCISGVIIAESYCKTSGVIFVFLATTSPLLIHYYSVPLPDIMATSLCLGAIAILVKSDAWPYFIISSFFIAISALIKSPIAFVFIVYYFTKYTIDVYCERPREIFVKCILLLSISLFAAILAEMIRKSMLGVHSVFANDPKWYFGTLEQRIASEFFGFMFYRLKESFALAAILFCGVLSMCFCLIFSLKTAIQIFIPFGIAFLSGWLVFTNVYLIHDYYEIPVVVIFFLAMSVAVQFTLNSVGRTATRPELIVPIRNTILLMFTPIIMLFMPKISEMNRDSIWSGIQFALRDTESLIYVREPSLEILADPSVGGRTRTKLKLLSKLELEMKCDYLLAHHSAFLVEGKSDCLSTHKGAATTFIEDSGLQFYFKSGIKS